LNIEEIKQFIEKHSMDAIIQYCDGLANDPTASNVEELCNFLKARFYVTERYPIIEHLSQRLIMIGKPGIQALEEVLKSKIPEVREAAILETLFQASKGKLFKQWNSPGDKTLQATELCEETSQLAHKSFVNIVMASLNDPSLFFDLVQFMYMRSTRALMNDEVDTSIFDIIAKSVIKINEPILNEYENKITGELTEEEYQKFLECNPCLIDPLASATFNKTKLGDDLITDFVVRRLDNIYILVEIEKPSTAIFTANDDFCSAFFHAIGQVMDFQEWVETNIAYAQKKMPCINSPQGLLIIGMKSKLTEKQKSKLNRFNISTRGRISVVTFDEILEQGRIYLANIYSK